MICVGADDGQTLGSRFIDSTTVNIYCSTFLQMKFKLQFFFKYTLSPPVLFLHILSLYRNPISIKFEGNVVMYNYYKRHIIYFVASNNFFSWLVDCFYIFIVSSLKCQTTTPSPTVLWFNSWFFEMRNSPSRINAR